MDDWSNIKNAEGYCKKCGQALGIEGRCYICAINETDDMLEGLPNCPKCGSADIEHRGSDNVVNVSGSPFSYIVFFECGSCGHRFSELGDD